MNALQELDLVTLRKPLPGSSLVAGDVGTIVFVYREGEAFEVEFTTADGKTVAVETLRADQIDPFAGQQILHARRFQPTR